MNTTKYSNVCVAAVLAVLTIASLSTNAQGWLPQTILDLDGQSSRAILVDPIPSGRDWPNLLVTGGIPGLNDVNGTPHKIFRLSQSDVPDPSNPELGILHASGATVYSMTSDHLGNLYWVGDLNSSTGNKWIVRRSGDGGTTWQEVQRWDLAAGMFARARGVSVDDAGRVFVCGLALDAAGYSHWIIQRSTDQGTTWTTKDLFKSSGQSSIVSGLDMVEGLGITFVPSQNGGPAALVVVGTVGKRYLAAWTVMRSTDAGETWQLAEKWVPKSGGSSRARKVVTDGGGRIFVLGDTGARTERDPAPWVIRMSRDGGITYAPIFGPWNYGPCPYPQDLTLDSSGDVWAVGAVHRSYQASRKDPVTYTTSWAVVRLHEELNGTWAATTDFPGGEAAGIYRAAANAATADDSGRVYVSGSFRANDSSLNQWIIQRFVQP